LLLSLWLVGRPQVALPNCRTAVFGLFVFAFLFVTSIWNGATFLEERWIQRYLAALFLFFYMQIFKSEKDVSVYLRGALSIFLLFICLESFYQFLFVCEVNDPLGPSCHASRFWNINMLSQAVVLCLPFVFVFRKYSSPRYAWGFDLLSALAVATIILTGCRSSIFALILLSAFQAIRVFRSHKKTLLILIVATAGTIAICSFGGSSKQETASYRWEVWKGAIEMSLDRPFGIGVNGFEFGFLPYKRDATIPSGPSEVDKSPHNEFVRILAEDGWGALALLSVGLVFILIALVRGVYSGGLSFQQQLVLVALPEFFFQFPTEMHFPVFLFCIGFAVQMAPKSRLINAAPIFRGALVACCALVLALLLVRNIELVNPRHSARYCSLFPDNWRMCAEYFKFHFEQGDFENASATIRPIIRRQPFNFVALNFDYLLGDEARNQVISCNYYALFKGGSSIEGSNVSACDPSLIRVQLIDNFIQYAKTR
jgi:hypothetical protein